MEKNKTRQMAVSAMIGALYTVLCLGFAPFSFGAVQVRLAEALTLLPIFSPFAVVGVTLGCAVSNLVGAMTGANILGLWDIPLGTLATFLAGICTWKLRNVRLSTRFGSIPWLAPLPPVLFNALIIGAELTVMMTSGSWNTGIFLINALQVGIGQIVSCYAVGLPFAVVLDRTGVARRCFGPIEHKAG
ncbi:QueT transporter family protein [Oscillospiraceae bacterium MB08-C2-2]|nr:QueT transporter family protein [Oscillospiraceae bacterium MB08-C2-2]